MVEVVRTRTLVSDFFIRKVKGGHIPFNQLGSFFDEHTKMDCRLISERSFVMHWRQLRFLFVSRHDSARRYKFILKLLSFDIDVLNCTELELLGHLEQVKGNMRKHVSMRRYCSLIRTTLYEMGRMLAYQDGEPLHLGMTQYAHSGNPMTEASQLLVQYQ